MKLKGEIKTGKNDFSFWINKLSSYYRQKTGITFFPGTLNVHLLDYKYYFPKNCLRLEKEEYGGTVSVSMTECRLFDKNAYILRTDSDTGKHGYPPEQILEIATEVKLRDEFNLQDGDVVEVEIDAGSLERSNRSGKRLKQSQNTATPTQVVTDKCGKGELRFAPTLNAIAEN